jgi:hypothetical protein
MVVLELGRLKLAWGAKGKGFRAKFAKFSGRQIEGWW